MLGDVKTLNHFMQRSFNLRCQVTDTQTQWRQRISASHGGEKNHSPASINPNYTDHHVSIVPLRPFAYANKDVCASYIASFSHPGGSNTSRTQHGELLGRVAF